MNSRERILAVLDLKQPDQVPFADYVEQEMRRTLMGRDNFSPLEFALEMGFDAINIDDFVSPVFCERRQVNGHDYILGGLIKKDKDLDLMVFPDPSDERFYDPAKRFIEKNADSGLAVYAICRFGISGVNYSMGIDGLSYALYENPALVDKVLDRYVDWNCRVVERLNNIGIDFIISYDNIAYNSGPLVSPQVFREVFVPKMKQIDAVCKLPWITHMDGNIMPIMEDILEMGVSGLHPIEPGSMDLKTVKQLYGDRVCLWGNIDLRYTLTRGTPEEVEEEVKTRIAEAGPGGGYILGSANGWPMYCKVENIRAMARAVKKYGQYPLQLNDCPDPGS
jgi:uroporphyrinogen decarboxylase